jgi:hypothetical protein
MMDDRLYKIRLVILWTAAGLLVLVGGALLALQTDAGKAYVLDEVTSRLNENLAGEVEADRVSGPLLWSATLHDFELRDVRANDVLRADEVSVTYSLIALLTGEFEFGRVRLEQPELSVRRYEDGTLNVATLTEPTPERGVEAEREIFAVPRFTISNGTIHYDGKTATGVNARGQLRVSSRGAFETTIDEIAFKTDAGQLTRVIEVEAEDVNLKRASEVLELTAAEIVVDGTSRVDELRLTHTPSDEPPSDETPSGKQADERGVGHLAGQIGTLTIAPELAELWPADLDLASPIEVELTFDGTTDDLGVDGVAMVRGGAEIEFDGTLDTSAPSVDLALTAENFQLADWIETKGPSMHVDATGTVEARRGDDGAIELKTRMTASNVEFDDHRAEKLVLGGREPFEVTLAPPESGGPDTGGSDTGGSDTGKPRRRLKARGDLEGTGVAGEKYALDSVEARVTVTSKSFEPGASIGYDVAGTASGARYGEHASDSAEFDLTGTLVRAPTGAEASVEKVVAEGTVDLRGYEGGGVRVDRLDSRVDIQHTPTSNVGDIRADLDRLVSNERTYGSGRIDLDMGQGGEFRLSVRAVPNIAPKLPLSLLTAGVHSQDFDVFEVAQFEVGRPGLQWKLRDEATIRLSDESVVIDSLVLLGPTQPIRLDGTYPRDGAAAAIIERLGLMSLEGLLQSEQIPEQLRERIPEDLEDLTPEELDRVVPDEVEDRLSDEIRKRLPKF